MSNVVELQVMSNSPLSGSRGPDTPESRPEQSPPSKPQKNIRNNSVAFFNKQSKCREYHHNTAGTLMVDETQLKNLMESLDHKLQLGDLKQATQKARRQSIRPVDTAPNNRKSKTHRDGTLHNSAETLFGIPNKPTDRKPPKGVEHTAKPTK